MSSLSIPVTGGVATAAYFQTEKQSEAEFNEGQTMFAVTSSCRVSTLSFQVHSAQKKKKKPFAYMRFLCLA